VAWLSHIVFREFVLLAEELVSFPLRARGVWSGLVAVLLDVVKPDLLPAMNRVDLVLTEITVD
jgi:hypothetical protein